MAKYVGADLIASVQMDYEYVGHDYDEFEDVENLLNLNLQFANDTDTYKTNIEHIGGEAVKYARAFITENGNIKTGALRDSITFDRTSANQWTLKAPARDKRGHPYAGHIEYGFSDRSGQQVGPFPFLRPAMRIAAADSTNDLAATMAWAALYGRGKLGRESSSVFSSNRLALGRSNIKRSTREAYETADHMKRGFSYGQRTQTWHTAYHGSKASGDAWAITNEDKEWFGGMI